jgi:hypothetical protein
MSSSCRWRGQHPDMEGSFLKKRYKYSDVTGKGHSLYHNTKQVSKISISEMMNSSNKTARTAEYETALIF